jgi:integrase
MASNARAYNISEALLRSEDAMSRWKGEQRGSLERVGDSYYGRWREFREKDGVIEWSQVKRKLCPASDGKAEAIRILNENVAQAGGPAACHQGIATLNQFVDARFRPDHIENLKASGKDHYKWCFGHILPAMGGYRLKEFNQQLVQYFLTTKSKQMSAQSVRHLRNAISAIFKHAKACGFWRGDVPTEYCKTPEVREKTTIALTQDQVSRLLLHMGEPYRTLTMLIASTGLRIGEAVALDWEHVDLQARVIRVRKNFTHKKWGTLKSKNSVRDLPISVECAMALETLRKDGQPLLFQARTGKPLDAHNMAADKLKPACKAAGIPIIGWHALRHTALSLLQGRGMTSADAQLVAGHGTAAMTARYTHGDVERLRGVVDGLSFTGGKITEVVQ